MIYLDYQATTPLAPEARAAMLPWLDEKYGNPHSPHRLGREAAAAVEAARVRVLAALMEDAAPGDPVRVEDVALRPDGGWPDAGKGVVAPSEGMSRPDGGWFGADASPDALPRSMARPTGGAVSAPSVTVSAPATSAGGAVVAANVSARLAPVSPVAGGLPGADGRGAVPSGRVVFTGGATEALNWAIKGGWARRPAGRSRIVTIATEHAAVLDTCATLAADGAEVVTLGVDRLGRVDLAEARAAIDERTVLVAAMLVNNEIGVIHPIAAIGALARAAGAVMLCDAVQGYGRVRVPVGACDLIAISAHKIHGPKGIGALWLRDGVEPAPLLHGGGQEGGIRSGTLSPMLCAGFGAAAEVARGRKGKDMAHIFGLYDRLRAALGQDWHVNGNRNQRWRGNLNIRRDGVDAARLISKLRGLAFSAGSACASGSGRPSHVLKAIGLTDAEARGSIRLGFGRYTTTDEIDAAAAQIVAAANRQTMGYAA